MSQVDFEYFDCDNHYYEATDAFTRYVEPDMKNRTMQWAEINGKQRLLVGARDERLEGIARQGDQPELLTQVERAAIGQQPANRA